MPFLTWTLGPIVQKSRHPPGIATAHSFDALLRRDMSSSISKRVAPPPDPEQSGPRHTSIVVFVVVVFGEVAAHGGASAPEGRAILVPADEELILTLSRGLC